MWGIFLGAISLSCIVIGIAVMAVRGAGPVIEDEMQIKKRGEYGPV